MRSLLRLIPWLVVLIVLSLYNYQYFTKTDRNRAERISKQDVILTSIETLGKLELSKFHFKEIIENKQISKEYFRLFKLGNDSKIVLICTGEAVGCLDFTKIKKQDIIDDDSVVYITLPNPELCYHKLNLEKTRIYALETSLFIDKNEFIEEAYMLAEKEIRKVALASNILEETKANAELILSPLIEQLTQKKVEINFSRETELLPELN